MAFLAGLVEAEMSFLQLTSLSSKKLPLTHVLLGRRSLSPTYRGADAHIRRSM